MSKFLVTGSRGQLGQCFQFIANQYPKHKLFFASRSEVNINDQNTLKDYFEKNPFQGIINCAAYTRVDHSESKAQLANKINAEGLKNLIGFAEDNNLILIHFSTDFVFDGFKEDPYQEKDHANPLNVYGQSKHEGEKWLQKANCLNVNFRISWLFSPFGKNFVKTIMKASQSGKECAVVNDQWGKPTYGIDLAKAVLSCLEHPNLFKHNTYHYAQEPQTSWFEFAKKIVKLSGGSCSVKPISSSKYPTIAKRPSNSVLDTQRLEKTLSLNIPSWEGALQHCIKTIQANEVI